MKKKKSKCEIAAKTESILSLFWPVINERAFVIKTEEIKLKYVLNQNRFLSSELSEERIVEIYFANFVEHSDEWRSGEGGVALLWDSEDNVLQVFCSR